MDRAVNWRCFGCTLFSAQGGPGGRGTCSSERVGVEVDSLEFQVSVPWASTIPPPQLGAGGRLPRDWITQFLHESPEHLEEQGINVQAVRLPEELLGWARDWDGFAVTRLLAFLWLTPAGCAPTPSSASSLMKRDEC